jgi:dimeric dUTPase (all-alpha-NTP-PPase superfamily)
MEDRLEKIFEYQKELQDIIENKRKDSSYFYDQGSMSFLGQKSFMILTAIIHEAVEAQRETAWKWWKDSKGINYELLREETIDIFHFIIQLCLELDITPNELMEHYQKKRDINIKRQTEMRY